MTTFFEDVKPHNGWAEWAEAERENDDDLVESLSIKTPSQEAVIEVTVEDVVNAMRGIRSRGVVMPPAIRTKIAQAYALNFYDDLDEQCVDAIIRAATIRVGS